MNKNCFLLISFYNDFYKFELLKYEFDAKRLKILIFIAYVNLSSLIYNNLIIMLKIILNERRNSN